jgi:hypothetical protein
MVRNVVTALMHHNGLYYFDSWTNGWFGKQSRAAESQKMWQAAQDAIAATRAGLSASGEKRRPRRS